MTRDERALLRVVERLARLPAEHRLFVVRRLTVSQMRALDEFWIAWRHKGQEEPLDFAAAGPSGRGKATWLMVAGRGFGKTRAGAEWVSALARADPSTLPGTSGPLRIALVGATIEDAVKVMVRGHSGLMAVARTGEEVRLNKTDGVVRFASGAQAFLYSGACPDKLRGPQHHVAWCDEIAKWRHPQETWDNLQLGLRLGARPRALVTTTPKALPLLQRLDATSAVTRGKMADNENLPAAFVAQMEAAYRGTRQGREELDGELIGDFEGALWTRALIERCRDLSVIARSEATRQSTGAEAGLLRCARNDDWKRVVIGVDPPATAQGDACGIMACALGGEGVAYVIGDHSVRGLSPEGWAGKVVEAARAWSADCVIVERNQGGDMVKSVLKTADAALPVRPVFARYGKGRRAEPVAMLFETGQARLAGSFPELEDELCAMTQGGGFAGRGGSPDRADAMVWAMSELMLGPEKAEPQIRTL